MQNLIGFKTAFFSLQWQGEEVGGIGFGPSRTPSTKVVTTDALITDDIHVTNSTAYQADTNADKVSVDVTSYGRKLQQEAVFMAIISALSDASAKPADERVTGIFNSFFHDYHCQVTTREVNPVRTTPPYYIFAPLIKSLVLAADHFVTKNDYRQLRMLVKVNDVPVANSLVVYKDSPHLSTLSGTTNGSSLTA